MKKILLIILAFIALHGTAIAQTFDLSSARRITWAGTVGVPGGIPSRSNICATLSPFGGGQDDQSQIQSAINSCPAGQVVYLNAGDYYLNNAGNNPITITKGITVRGAGPALTKIHSSINWHPFQIGNWPGTLTARNVSGSPAKGDTSITLSSVSGLAIGNYIVIDQLNDQTTEVINVDMEDARGNGATTTGRNLNQMSKITNIVGNVVYLDTPLHHTYSSSQTPQAWKLNITMTEYAGVENLFVEQTVDNGMSNFKIVACAYCWLKNVEGNLAAFRHVDLDRSFRCEIRDSYFHHGYNYGTGGDAYGVVTGRASNNHLIENNIFYYLRHAMVMIGGSSGNVFGYNYSVASYQGSNWLAPDFFDHGSHTTANLIEGNYLDKIDSDSGHGSGSYNVFFRNNVIDNSSATTIANGRRAINVDKYHYWNSYVGNILGTASTTFNAYQDSGTRNNAYVYVHNFGYNEDGSTTASETKPRTTVFRHGNYDYYTNSQRYCSSETEGCQGESSSLTLPNSFYLSAAPSWWCSETTWPPVNPATPLVSDIPAKRRYNSAACTLSVTSGSLLYGNFGTGAGIWEWDGGTWGKLHSLSPENMAASGSMLYATFTGHGLWKLEDGAWSQLHSVDPAGIAVSGSTLYVNFTSYGLYKYEGGAWSQLHSLSPANVAASGSTLYATFTGHGLWKLEGGAWRQLHSVDPSGIAVSGSTLYVNFTAYGLYKYDGSTWSQLHSLSPANVAASGSTLYATFTGHGLWKLEGGSWSQLHSVDPAGLAFSRSTLYVNFTLYGLYKYDGSAWTQLHSLSPANMVAS